MFMYNYTMSAEQQFGCGNFSKSGIRFILDSFRAGRESRHNGVSLGNLGI